MTKVFIDGKEGTTGLQIWERLANRDDIELLVLPEHLRKDPAARRQALNSCDIAFFCLPDAAAREAAAMIENPTVRVIDASTAHRTSSGWTYGFPELSADIRLPPGWPIPAAMPADLSPWFVPWWPRDSSPRMRRSPAFLSPDTAAAAKE